MESQGQGENPRPQKNLGGKEKGGDVIRFSALGHPQGQQSSAFHAFYGRLTEQLTAKGVFLRG